jgi:Zn-dependent protease with chaperone function
MIAALLVFGYSVVMACWLPAVLTPLTRNGAGARLGIAAWATAMASVLSSAGVAAAFLIRSAVNGWSGLAEAVCRSVAGGACAPVVYRSALYELGLGIAAIIVTLTAIVLIWRYGRRIQQAQRQTRAHGEAARITGRRLPGPGPCGKSGMVVLEAPQLAAYCVPGRPGTIVVTSGALSVLEPAQLTAVLAHERAHLAGRHHLLIALTRGLAAVFPAVPLFTRGQSEIARLAEMRADDAAAHRAGRRPLIEALLAMGTGGAVRSAVPMPAAAPIPAAALTAAGYAVAARVQRLMEPPTRASRARFMLALSGLLMALPAVSGLIFVLASGS